MKAKKTASGEISVKMSVTDALGIVDLVSHSLCKRNGAQERAVDFERAVNGAIESEMPERLVAIAASIDRTYKESLKQVPTLSKTEHIASLIERGLSAYHARAH